jgi:hypothetical protein
MAFMWKWPAAFGLGNSQRMADLNQVSQEWSDAVHREIAALSANPNAVMITPMVMKLLRCGNKFVGDDGLFA